MNRAQYQDFLQSGLSLEDYERTQYGGMTKAESDAYAAAMTRGADIGSTEAYERSQYGGLTKAEYDKAMTERDAAMTRAVDRASMLAGSGMSENDYAIMMGSGGASAAAAEAATTAGVPAAERYDDALRGGSLWGAGVGLESGKGMAQVDATGAPIVMSGSETATVAPRTPEQQEADALEFTSRDAKTYATWLQSSGVQDTRAARVAWGRAGLSGNLVTIKDESTNNPITWLDPSAIQPVTPQNIDPTKYTLDHWDDYVAWVNSSGVADTDAARERWGSTQLAADAGQIPSTRGQDKDGNAIIYTADPTGLTMSPTESGDRRLPGDIKRELEGMGPPGTEYAFTPADELPPGVTPGIEGTVGGGGGAGGGGAIPGVLQLPWDPIQRSDFEMGQVGGPWLTPESAVRGTELYGTAMGYQGPEAPTVQAGTEASQQQLSDFQRAQVASAAALSRTAGYQQQLAVDMQKQRAMYEAAARGEAPSAAAIQQQAGLADALRNQMALAATSRAPGAWYAAGQQGDRLQGQAIQNAMMLRAQEQAAAREQLTGYMGSEAQARAAAASSRAAATAAQQGLTQDQLARLAQELEASKSTAANTLTSQGQANEMQLGLLGQAATAEQLRTQALTGESAENKAVSEALQNFGTSTAKQKQDYFATKTQAETERYAAEKAAETAREAATLGAITTGVSAGADILGNLLKPKEEA